MFTPPGYAQMDGSKFQRENCVLATCTDLIDRGTVGALRVPAPRLRELSGDTSGGVTYSQAAATAAKATTRITLTPRTVSRAQTRDMGEAGIPFGISIHTSVTKDTRFRTGTFIGGHTVYVQDYDEADDTFLVDDPGTAAGYMWWPADLLFRAAEARGGGRINVLAGPDTEGVWRTARIKANVHAKADAASAILATVVPTHGYFVLSTVNGGPWTRTADGGQSNGWHRIRRAAGSGFVRGEALA